MKRALALPTLMLTFALAVGCTSDGGGTEIAVTGTNKACTPTETDLDAGKLTFAFTNEADDISELYVLREDGSVVGEVENVTTGSKRSLDVDLVAGSYELRCKPGQTGEGFSTKLQVTGKGGTPQKKADRTKKFTAIDFEYENLDLSDVTAGETIRFEMHNGGTEPHEFEVLGPDGEAIGEVESTKVGKDGAATISFDEAGEYTYQCILVDPKTDQPHTELGMLGTFSVADKS